MPSSNSPNRSGGIGAKGEEMNAEVVAALHVKLDKSCETLKQISSALSANEIEIAIKQKSTCKYLLSALQRDVKFNFMA